MLDSASGGSLYENTALQGEILIDKLIKNGRSSDDEDAPRKKKEHGVLEKNMAELNEKLDKILWLQNSKEETKTPDEIFDRHEASDDNESSERVIYNLDSHMNHEQFFSRRIPKTEMTPTSIKENVKNFDEIFEDNSEQLLSNSLENVKGELENLLRKVIAPMLMDQAKATKRMDALATNLEKKINTWEKMQNNEDHGNHFKRRKSDDPRECAQATTLKCGKTLLDRRIKSQAIEQSTRQMCETIETKTRKKISWKSNMRESP